MHLPIDVVLTEREMARDFAAALRRRALPDRLLYWPPAAVSAWLALCGDAAEAPARLGALLARHAADIAARTLAGAVDVVSLGAGDGERDRVLLRALAAAGREVTYRPVDASVALLELAVRDAIGDGFGTVGVKADFTDPFQLQGIARGVLVPRATRCFLLLGGTLGAGEPAPAIRALAALMREGDVAVIDAELAPRGDGIGADDTAAWRRFAFAALESAGAVPEDGELRLEEVADARHPGVRRTERHFAATRTVLLDAGGETVPVRAGERVALGETRRFEERAIHALLAEARLGARAMYRSGDGRCVAALVGREGDEERQLSPSSAV